MAASRAPELTKAFDVPRSRDQRTALNADTSSQPEGITRRVMLNILEAFFRRPMLHLLPLILMLGLGLASVLAGTEQYQSVGTLSVTNQSLLADLTNSTQNAGLGFESPAEVTASQINELLGSGVFLDSVIRNAELDDLLEGGLLAAGQIRNSTTASAAGNNIVRVGSTTRDPRLSFLLAEATIESYLEWEVEADVTAGTSTVESLEQRVADKQAAAETADDAVGAFIEAHPNLDLEEGLTKDVVDFQLLQDTADRAHEQLVAAEDALDAAKLQTDQAPAIVSQQIRVLDQPEQGATGGRLKKAALTMILFGVIGAILSLVSVVISATLDRTIRVPNDITARFGVDVLAVVPNTGR